MTPTPSRPAGATGSGLVFRLKPVPTTETLAEEDCAICLEKLASLSTIKMYISCNHRGRNLKLRIRNVKDTNEESSQNLVLLSLGFFSGSRSIFFKNKQYIHTLLESHCCLICSNLYRYWSILGLSKSISGQV